MLKNYKKQNAESSDVCCPYADMTSTNVNVIFIILQSVLLLNIPRKSSRTDNEKLHSLCINLVFWYKRLRRDENDV